MNKKLVIINGAPGIGKTQTCRALQPFLERSVWLDGDWCWMANPWIVTTETKRMAENNMVFMLNNFLNCTEYEFVLYSWIFRSDEVFRIILDRLKLDDCMLNKYTLTCSQDVFRKRLEDANREESKIQMCIESLYQCKKTESEKIDTTHRSVEEVASTLLNRILNK